MPATLEDMTQQVLQLPARQRLALAGFLLEVDDASDQSEVEEAWEKEIQERIQAIDSGSTMGIAYSDVMSEADQLLAR
ncbi:MAG: addiction module protein [Verrucomicrobia bacterium]|nr:addiction module protein [Verrucomicrobiota bacterium]